LDVNLLDRSFSIDAFTNLDGGFLLSGYIKGGHIGGKTALENGDWPCWLITGH
jgi:hypothetical protein